MRLAAAHSREAQTPPQGIQFLRSEFCLPRNIGTVVTNCALVGPSEKVFNGHPVWALEPRANARLPSAHTPGLGPLPPLAELFVSSMLAFANASRH